MLIMKLLNSLLCYRIEKKVSYLCKIAAFRLLKSKKWPHFYCHFLFRAKHGMAIM